MKVLILTQNECLYLPMSFAKVCEARAGNVACIVVSPAMSTHGGMANGFIRHFRLFGLSGTFIMVWRFLLAKIRGRFGRQEREGPFYSLRAVATAFDIPYYEIAKVNSDELRKLIDENKPDLLVSISCPQIIGKRIRDRFPKGCINVHGAPLPRYRGLMPTFWVLRNGEERTATTVHDLGDRLDNGDILVQKQVPIEPDDTWDSLVRKTKAVGADALIEAIEQIDRGTVVRLPNREEDATYFSFPTAKDRKAFLAAGRRFF